MAVQLACAAQEVLLSQEPRLAADLRRDDRAVHRLYRQLLAVLIEPNWVYGVARGVDVALLSVLYERFADYAVHIAERYTYQSNGDRPAVQPPKITP
ncbi:PhoU domain-containing protein [uncultured Mycobacterium sp.]|uniref:PhoU domain-containing protein n=1 Tax=uncultured Mycobacterium sp. TaxID=171292 RepID=UPI0035CAA1C3